MSKLRQSARDKPCTLQIFPYCCEDPATTVLCHLNSPSKGMGLKSNDWFAVYGCSECHSVLDNRTKHDISDAEMGDIQLRALWRTWDIMIEEGLIKTPPDGSRKRVVVKAHNE